MKCVNPRRLPNPAAKGVEDAFIMCSCGKCYACLSNRRRSWLFRLQNESLDSVITLFCTLTYNDVSCDGYVHKDHLQKFFKKLRHYEEFKYYAIGEYGTKTQRPHYHCVIFFKSAPDSYPLDNLSRVIDYCWSQGHVSVSRAHYRRLNYVLHYHVRPKEINGKKTFSLYSKALGIGFLTRDYLHYLMATNSSVIHDFNGNIYVVPRYYRKKLKDIAFIGNTSTSFFDSSFVIDLKRDDNEFFKQFGKHLYETSVDQVNAFLRDRILFDQRKLNNYNNQDKFI